MAAKRPSFQFYSADWLKDPAVRSVSLAARGLWIDMLCLMDQSSRRGYLQHATGKPVTADQLARMTGCSTDEASRLLQELSDSGVYSSTDNGVVFSRRMVSDERKREACQQAGRRGGNPTLIRTPKGGSKGGVKPAPNPEITPSSSSSSSIKETPLPPEGEISIPAVLDTSEFREAWASYVEYRKTAKLKPLKHVSIDAQFRRMAEWATNHGAPAVIQCIRNSIAQGWTGIFEPKDGDRKPTKPEAPDECWNDYWPPAGKRIAHMTTDEKRKFNTPMLQCPPYIKKKP